MNKLSIIHEDKTNTCLTSVFICDKDTLAVLDKFLAGFSVSNKVNFQSYFANKLIKCNNIWHLHSLSIDESHGYVLGNSSVVMYILTTLEFPKT